MSRLVLACSTLLVLILTVVSVNAWGSMSTIAIVSKVVQDVGKKVGSTDWTKAAKGDALGSGDLIRTGDKSFAIVKFKDNSIVRVREKSELKLEGDVKGTAFSKSIELNRGVIGFEIQKQENEQFTFTSPTSVASIRGTKGAFGSGDEGDELIVVQGMVNLLNTSSNSFVDVGAGQTGISRPSGQIEVRSSSPQERDKALGALQTGDEGKLKDLKIELKDPQGNTKELKIRYRD